MPIQPGVRIPHQVDQRVICSAKSLRRGVACDPDGIEEISAWILESPAEGVLVRPESRTCVCDTTTGHTPRPQGGSDSRSARPFTIGICSVVKKLGDT